MIDQLATGARVTCTITAEPRNRADRVTLGRLMKLDSGIQRGLRRAQRRRRQNMRVYTRGGRDWYAREKCGKGGQVRVGQTFTIAYVPQLAPDIRAVESYLKIDAAKA
ncbi:MAG: hypothetical protein KIT54_01610 [Phycisphaeraceae bacterium]|nr:hypothetical protein [Phycisphaeraceae bacterium]